MKKKQLDITMVLNYTL